METVAMVDAGPHEFGICSVAAQQGFRVLGVCVRSGALQVPKHESTACAAMIAFTCRSSYVLFPAGLIHLLHHIRPCTGTQSPDTHTPSLSPCSASWVQPSSVVSCKLCCLAAGAQQHGSGARGRRAVAGTHCDTLGHCCHMLFWTVISNHVSGRTTERSIQFDVASPSVHSCIT
jgi:hypothetical protein